MSARNGSSCKRLEPYRATRSSVSAELLAVVKTRWGIDPRQVEDLGGSYNLNLLVVTAEARYVVRLYMPHVTAQRLAEVQLVRRKLTAGGVPCDRLVPAHAGEWWAALNGRLVEVERFVESDAKMDSWERLESGLLVLGRIHTLLRGVETTPDGANPAVANYVELAQAMSWTRAGTTCIRRWTPTGEGGAFADAAEELARSIEAVGIDQLPRQLVHGDFWDNNVYFSGGRVVHVGDFDFMGERMRIDDLALTLFFANSTLAGDRFADDRIAQLRRLVDAYDEALADRLSPGERRALPLAMARVPLVFVGIIGAMDEEHARREVRRRHLDLDWALAVMRDLEDWQAAFVER